MRTRAIRHRVRRRPKSTFEIDITSLLDILIILLIFLLKNYSSSGLVFNIQEGIKLPNSNSSTINTPGLIVQVSPNTILVDDKVVLDMANQPPQIFDEGRQRRIIPLFDALVQKREEARLIKRSVPEAKPFSGVINFVIDKTVGYRFLKKLMYTSAEAGYFKFNFVVLGEEV